MIVTAVPVGPVVGEKLVIVGGGITVKLVVDVPVPASVVTPITPVVAPTGTVTLSWVSEITENASAASPLNATDVTPV